MEIFIIIIIIIFWKYIWWGVVFFLFFAMPHRIQTGQRVATKSLQLGLLPECVGFFCKTLVDGKWWASSSTCQLSFKTVSFFFSLLFLFLLSRLIKPSYFPIQKKKKKKILIHVQLANKTNNNKRNWVLFVVGTPCSYLKQSRLWIGGGGITYSIIFIRSNQKRAYIHVGLLCYLYTFLCVSLFDPRYRAARYTRLFILDVFDLAIVANKEWLCKKEGKQTHTHTHRPWALFFHICVCVCVSPLNYSLHIPSSLFFCCYLGQFTPVCCPRSMQGGGW